MVENREWDATMLNPSVRAEIRFAGE